MPAGSSAGSSAPPDASAPTSPPPTSVALPARVFAPYVEMWLGDSLTGLAEASGAKYQTLAFLESTGTASCEIAWNGSTKLDTVMGRQIATDAAALRAMGGDIIPSFGGYSADHEGREIADSCTDVDAIADVYEAVIDAYGVSRLDMDVEVESVDRGDGVDRRNRAIRVLQDRLASDGRTVEIQYTLPVSPRGLADGSLAILRNAVEHGAAVDIVNIMVFDYYGGGAIDMGDAAIAAAEALHVQLATIYPDRTDAERWSMIGLTLMPGIDDNPDKSEVTTLQDAEELAAFAAERGLSHLSMWALQRDNGDCPGAPGNGECSGVEQDQWAFSEVLGAFTSP